MYKKIFLVTSMLATIIPLIANSQNILHDSTIKALRMGLEGFKDRFHSPSIVISIVHDKQIIFSEALGYTDVDNKVAATIDSKYPVLSVTKVFTATMLMQLKQRNILILEDDVKKFVPEFTGSSSLSSKSGTTLLQLATHTSGLPRNSQADIHFTKQVDKWLLAGENYTTIESAKKETFLTSLKFIKKEYPDYQLLSYGDRHYSNLGYSLLGIALERAAKKDFALYVLNNICKPLKMDNTGFDSEKLDDNILAKGYYYDDSTKNLIKTPVYKSNSALYAGGMYSTARDLSKFISFQFDNKSAETYKILSPENKAMMQSLRIAWKPSFPFVFHEGAMLGYRSLIAFNPELKIGWVILTNATDFEFSRINEYLSKLLTPLFNKKPETDLNKFTGLYVLADSSDRINIYLKNGKLHSTYLHDILPELPLTPTGFNKFKGQGRGNYAIGYDFISNEDAEVKYLNLGQLMWIKE